MEQQNPFTGASLWLPERTTVIHMPETERIEQPEKAIEGSLLHPIGSESLSLVAKRKATGKVRPRAVVVVSDNTRPVPYKGEEGILLPIVRTLVASGYLASDILILIANGTHRAMRKEEILAMIDERVLAMGCPVANHDFRDEKNLVCLGTTGRRTVVDIDKRYMKADLKIATGLVESHFMAGASGGRKAICPGLVGERTTHVFHGPALMGDPLSRDLVISGNPVHEESLAVAKMAGVDFLVNVTLDHAFHITGVFSGDLEEAHLAAVEKVRQSVSVSLPHGFDVVVTHGGYVGVNHYQCAKCAVASLGILNKGGWLVVIADTRDKGNPVGGINYRTAVSLLKLQGWEGFMKTISSPDWTFLPEQWQVQEWAKVFRRIPMNHLILYSPSLSDEEWEGLPGINGRMFLKGDEKEHAYRSVVEGALRHIGESAGEQVKDLSVAYVADGPYVVPLASSLS
jgi:nickel-dependent lactate racemase